jgi:hypothetical protein
MHCKNFTIFRGLNKTHPQKKPSAQNSVVDIRSIPCYNDTMTKTKTNASKTPAQRASAVQANRRWRQRHRAWYHLQPPSYQRRFTIGGLARQRHHQPYRDRLAQWRPEYTTLRSVRIALREGRLRVAELPQWLAPLCRTYPPGHILPHHTILQRFGVSCVALAQRYGISREAVSKRIRRWGTADPVAIARLKKSLAKTF